MSNDALETHAKSTSVGQGPFRRVAIILLAAGQATRMGPSGAHKLLAEFDGIPLVRRMAAIALESSARAVILVTGHRRSEIETAIEGLRLELVDNPQYLSGMASSLIAGVSRLQDRAVEGALVMLADMPGLRSSHLDELINAFQSSGCDCIVRAACHGSPGNPVILPKSLYPNIFQLQGDIGARHLIENASLPVIQVEIGEAALLDLDTPESVVEAGGIIKN
ncbi:nucleotidyltransferase family protein (plasmid) [Rhizobium sp. CB3060]|uniref:nucleotidyltransferase family protein n=1 Tax=Rhizobium sp. CB3060 TaxID=3138255 RepID=UPI0021A6B317|nr:nucleotidyltransferase family protein [Rhizobium tropici]UWU25868.1 nucleotidyltransferase family protein [Rhizobium tropici]